MAEIKRWDTGAVIAEGETVKTAVDQAVREGQSLCRADLTRANLSRANLTRANLARANLARANLSGAYLSGAYLSGANLSGANLSGANLSGADLAGCCLEPMPTVYEWARDHKLPMRVVDGRTLVMAWRTKHQPHMGGPDYEIGKVYFAEPFSRDPVASCHPGRHVDFEGEMAVVFWLDEGLVAGTASDYKVRCKRFRTLAMREDRTAPEIFDKLTAQDMESEGKTDE